MAREGASLDSTQTLPPHTPPAPLGPLPGEGQGGQVEPPRVLLLLPIPVPAAAALPPSGVRLSLCAIPGPPTSPGVPGNSGPGRNKSERGDFTGAGEPDPGGTGPAGGERDTGSGGGKAGFSSHGNDPFPGETFPADNGHRENPSVTPGREPALPAAPKLRTAKLFHRDFQGEFLSLSFSDRNDGAGGFAAGDPPGFWESRDAAGYPGAAGIPGHLPTGLTRCCFWSRPSAGPDTARGGHGRSR